MTQRLIDISPPLSPEIAVFPGDSPLRREVLLDMRRGDHLTLSTLHSTAHLGAHADGANHYGMEAPAIDAMPLELYLGECQVVHAFVKGRRVRVDDLEDAVDSRRVLIRTDSFPDPNAWNADFAAIEPALVDHLADRGVKLVGIDTPSVDAADANRLVAHHRLLARNVAILEGLVLRDVSPGRYELIALPLRLVGFDASPVRAVLRTIG